MAEIGTPSGEAKMKHLARMVHKQISAPLTPTEEREFSRRIAKQKNIKHDASDKALMSGYAELRKEVERNGGVVTQDILERGEVLNRRWSFENFKSGRANEFLTDDIRKEVEGAGGGSRPNVENNIRQKYGVE